ncbi:MAG: hypothetical protein A2506_04430 [Elusimicrobia bacterium RIFOXYD12_FULL_66_9]|nr:MAG: hypothetical protein A2506_04430 [Elusimicrobia bacterium RIFOXYD12_FULL_66_9]
MEKIAIFGKGGIGKSTICVGLSVVYALEGRKVLHVGCDPKHDSTAGLLQGAELPTFMDKMSSGTFFRPGEPPSVDDLCRPGWLGIDCVEAGGPDPGVGCAGRGISLMLETFEEARLLEKKKYDVCMFDVLGDVVCGGFAAPLRKGFAQKVLIVVSEEMMSLYAANNIAKAVRNCSSNGVFLAGLAVNARSDKPSLDRLERFAKSLNTRILAVIPRDPMVVEAEFTGATSIVESHPARGFSRGVKSLARKLLAATPRTCPAPSPLDDKGFYRQWRA